MMRINPARVLVAGAASAALAVLSGGYATASAESAAGPAGPAAGFAALRDSTGLITGQRTGNYTSARMSVELTLAPRDPAGLAAALRAAYTPGSGAFHRWLAAGQFDARYAPAATVRSAVIAYLRSAGLTVAGSPSPFLIRATGTSAQVQGAFRTSLGSYRNGSGTRYFANSTAARLPAGLARDVLGVTGLTNTARPHSMLMTPGTAKRPAARGRRRPPSRRRGRTARRPTSRGPSCSTR